MYTKNPTARNNKINFAQQAQLAKLCFAMQLALDMRNIAYSLQSNHVFFNSEYSVVVPCNVLRIAIAPEHVSTAAQVLQLVAAHLQITLRKVAVRNNSISAIVA